MPMRGDEVPSREPGTALGVTVACCGLLVAALPLFLVAGLAVQIRAELDISEAALGAAVSVGLLAAAVLGPLVGRLADRIGARAAVVAGAACSALASTGVAVAVHHWIQLAALLALSGAGVAFVDPGLAILLGSAVPARWQGLAFGVREAAIPAATFAAGVAVPAIALTIGWRWAFAVGVAARPGGAATVPLGPR